MEIERIPDLRVVIKGAGEMATGIAHRLYMAGIRQIVMTDIAQPLTVRRTVAFSEAIFNGIQEVEGVKASYVSDIEEIPKVWREGKIAVIIDPEWNIIKALKPYVVVDAIMAKRNLGTSKKEAPIVIGVGPGFSAPEIVHAAVESNRGHNLGRVYYKGGTQAHTGIPGAVMGHTTDRVLRAPHKGIVRHVKSIGDLVKKGETLMFVDNTPIVAPFDGVLRGLIREIAVEKNEKIGDVDPAGIAEYCYAITEKARAIGGGVLEAIMHYIYLRET